MTQPLQDADRTAASGWLRRVAERPEMGALCGMVALLVLLPIVAGDGVFNPLGLKHHLATISQLGIIATAVCLLMIAGEFDLSIGAMAGFAGVSMAIMMKWGLPFGLGPAAPMTAFFITLGLTLTTGWLLGNIVVRSGLSSLIVSLAFLVVLRGVTEGALRLFNHGSMHISGLPEHSPQDGFAALFGGESLQWFYDVLFWLGWNSDPAGDPWITGFDVSLAWWAGIVAVAYLVLSRTQLGNWIYATGDNEQGARANGVPTSRVKIGLFMLTALCATVFAACQVFGTGSAGASIGNLKELEALAAAVVGGAVLSGGYGSVVGVVFGAAIFGLMHNAVYYVAWIDDSHYRVFLGTVLLAFAIANENIRKRVTGEI